jgi:lantibiotic transport system permease protein
MSNYWNALSAERVKLRRTLARRMCWLAPLIVVVLYVLLFVTRELGVEQPVSPKEAWLNFANACWGLWSFLMLPLFITLQSALLAGLEHNEQQWKHLLALPTPKPVHYVAKWIALLYMTFFAFFALVVFIVVAGYLLSWFRPDLGIRDSAPFAYLAEVSIRVLAAAMLMTAIHIWIAVRWRSFTVAVATGMSATVIGFLVAQSEQYGRFYPWAMPVQVFAYEGANSDFVVIAGLISSLVVFAFGVWDFNSHDAL